MVTIKKKRKKEKKFGHPIHIPYYATWKSSESNDTVRVQHLFAKLISVLSGRLRKESEEFQCIAQLRNVSHSKWAEIFIFKNFHLGSQS